MPLFLVKEVVQGPTTALASLLEPGIQRFVIIVRVLCVLQSSWMEFYGRRHLLDKRIQPTALWDSQDRRRDCVLLQVSGKHPLVFAVNVPNGCEY